MLCPAPSSHPSLEVIKEDITNLCLKLQKLETLYGEISSTPAQMPMEKELMLQESWQRIKLVELELEKTKKVSYHYVTPDIVFKSSVLNIIKILLSDII